MFSTNSLDENFEVDPVNNNRFNKAIYLLICCSILYKIFLWERQYGKDLQPSTADTPSPIFDIELHEIQCNKAIFYVHL